MVITNSLKLFMRNGGLVWRIMAYFLLVGLLVVGITFAICYPLIAKLSEAGFFAQIAELIGNSFVNIRIDQIFIGIGQLLINLGEIIIANLNEILPLLIIFVLIVIVLGSFLLGLSEIAVLDCLYGYMGSNSKLGFASCFVKNLGKSLKLQLSKLLINIPYMIIITLIIIGSLFIFNMGGFWIQLIVPTGCVLLLTLFASFKSTLFCTWTAGMVVQNWTVWHSFAEGVKSVWRNFGKIYGRRLVLTLSFVAINVLAWILTACVGCILTIPATVLFVNIFNMVVYFSTNGLRFYVDSESIHSPKKKEDWEPIRHLKDII